VIEIFIRAPGASFVNPPGLVKCRGPSRQLTAVRGSRTNEAMSMARLLVWLVTAVAFIAPPSLAHASPAAVAPPAAVTAVDDCPHHAPPPDPCPDSQTAKHAAGECCPMMAGAVALLPAVAEDGPRPFIGVSLASIARNLTSFSTTKDPPPPRV
jgi:hypothetical protein